MSLSHHLIRAGRPHVHGRVFYNTFEVCLTLGFLSFTAGGLLSVLILDGIWSRNCEHLDENRLFGLAFGSLSVSGDFSRYLSTTS